MYFICVYFSYKCIFHISVYVYISQYIYAHKHRASSSYSLNKYLLSIYWLQNNILGAEDIAVNTEGLNLRTGAFHIPVMGRYRSKMSLDEKKMNFSK